LEIFSQRVGIFSFVKKIPLPEVEVKAGEVLGLIKGISIQDPVNSPCNGKITEIHVKDGEIVEFGKLLFKIKPTIAS